MLHIDFEAYFEEDEHGDTKCWPCICNKVHHEYHEDESPPRLSLRADLSTDTSHMSHHELEKMKEHKAICEDDEDDIHECFGEFMVCK